MANKIFLLGLFLLSVANVKAQTRTQTDSLTMETMLHNLPEVMVKGSRPLSRQSGVCCRTICRYS